MSEPREGAPQTSAADVRVVAKGGAIQFIGMATNRAASLLFVAIAVRLLGTAGFGLYRQLSQLLITVAMVATVGFDTAVLRSIAQARAKGEAGGIRGAMRVAVVSVTIVAGLAFLVLVLAAGPIAGAFADDAAGRDRMVFLLRLGAGFVPLYALMQVLRSSTVGYRTVFPSVVVGNVIQPVTLLLVASIAVAGGYGVAGAVGGLVTSSVVGVLAGLWFYRRLLPAEERRAAPQASIRSMTAFALPRAGTRLVALGGAGTILLGLFGTDQEVGLFAVAISLQSIVLIFLQAILSIWQPMVVDLLQRGEVQRLGVLYQTVNRWVASCSFGFLAGLLILPEPFVQILGGGGVEGAALLVAVLAMGTFIEVGTGPCGMLITMAGYPIINLVNTAAVMALYITAAWLIVPTHGALGMAIIHAGSMALANLLRVVAAKWLTGLQPFGRSFLKPVVAALVAAAFLVAWRALIERGTAIDVTGLFVGAVLYLGVLWVAGVDQEDRVVYRAVKARVRSLVSGRVGFQRG